VKPGFLMRRVLILLAAGPLAGLAALSSSAPPTAAAAVTHGALHPVTGAVAALEQSTNWSGFAVTGGAYTRATGSWVVPRSRSPRTSATRRQRGVDPRGSHSRRRAGSPGEHQQGHLRPRHRQRLNRDRQRRDHSRDRAGGQHAGHAVRPGFRPRWLRRGRWVASAATPIELALRTPGRRG